MLKILFSPEKAERHPIEVFFLGLIYSSISILFAVWVFPDYASIAMIFLTVFSCLYLIQSAIRVEEKKDLKNKSEKWLLKEHSHIIIFLLFLFLGFVISFTLWAFFLPVDKEVALFETQKTIVEGIKTAVSGFESTGNFISSSNLMMILGNNMKVLLVSLAFAFFYGAGAIYVLVWNASVMGFVIGNLAKNTLGLSSLPITFTKYFVHGIPEMLAYLIVAVAGGILYFAFIRGDLSEKNKRKKILSDVLLLILLSILILVIAAAIEVYISPYV